MSKKQNWAEPLTPYNPEEDFEPSKGEVNGKRNPKKDKRDKNKKDRKAESEYWQ